MNFLPASIVLPDRLQELSTETDRIITHAKAIENDINTSGYSTDHKRKLIRAAITDLDAQASGVYFGQNVEVEGAYSFPVPHSDGNEISFKMMHEVGVRRGESFGFLAEMVEFENETAAENVQARLYHGITLGRIALSTNPIDLSGIVRLLAPINESGLSLCAVEDYKVQIQAEQQIRRSKEDAEWADALDELLYSADGPDLKQLGGLLINLRRAQGDKIHDYVSYINAILKNDGDVAEVLCDHLLDYAPSRSNPTWLSSSELITGWNPTIALGDAYKIDRAKQNVIKLKNQQPVLTLRAQVGVSTDEHILHIPLQAIQCSEFK